MKLSWAGRACLRVPSSVAVKHEEAVQHVEVVHSALAVEHECVLVHLKVGGAVAVLQKMRPVRGQDRMAQAMLCSASVCWSCKYSLNEQVLRAEVAVLRSALN